MQGTTWMLLANTLISALIIGFSTSIAKANPTLAGYITALPLTSLLALSLAYGSTGDGEATSRYAISILAAIPLSLLFFVPFLFYTRFRGSLWLYIGVGLVLLYLGSFIQRAIASRLIGS